MSEIENTPQTEENHAVENSGSEAAPSMTLEQALSALEAERGKKEKAVAAEKNLRERLKAAEASKSDEVKSAEQRFSGMLKTLEERSRKQTERAVKGEVKALAADLLQNPADAHAFLDLSKYADEDGEIDSDAIRSDLAALVEERPYLAKSKGPKSNPAQGASGSTPPKEEALTRDDLKKMAPEEIYKALQEGKLKGVLGA